MNPGISGCDRAAAMRYFDHNATHPVTPAAREAYLHVVDEFWHNPSAAYRAAARVRCLLDEAREQLAEWLNRRPDEVIFTSGATESNNAVFASVGTRSDDGVQVLVSTVEHPSIIEAARHWACGGVRFLNPESVGVIDPELLRKHLREQPVRLVSIQAANNETGVIQPVRGLAEVCREFGVAFHCDAVQWAGKMPLAELQHCDAVTLSAHKFGGPRGAGVLVASRALDIAFMKGGGQEGERRSGTENVAAIAGMMAALEPHHNPEPPADRFAMRKEFIEHMQTVFGEGFRLVGSADGAGMLWNTVGFCMSPHRATRWVTRLEREGFLVGTGSACSAGKSTRHPSLEAVGIDDAAAERFLRVSSGWHTSADDWRELARAFKRASDALDRDVSADADNSPVVIIPEE